MELVFQTYLTASEKVLLACEIECSNSLQVINDLNTQ